MSINAKLPQIIVQHLPLGLPKATAIGGAAPGLAHCRCVYYEAWNFGACYPFSLFISGRTPASVVVEPIDAPAAGHVNTLNGRVCDTAVQLSYTVRGRGGKKSYVWTTIIIIYWLRTNPIGFSPLLLQLTLRWWNCSHFLAPFPH